MGIHVVRVDSQERQLGAGADGGLLGEQLSETGDHIEGIATT